MDQVQSQLAHYKYKEFDEIKFLMQETESFHQFVIFFLAPSCAFAVYRSRIPIDDLISCEYQVKVIASQARHARNPRFYMEKLFYHFFQCLANFFSNFFQTQVWFPKSRFPKVIQTKQALNKAACGRCFYKSQYSFTSFTTVYPPHSNDHSPLFFFLYFSLTTAVSNALGPE